MTLWLGPVTPTFLPCLTSAQIIRAQATYMGYADSFALLAMVLLGAALTVALMKKGAASGVGAH